ncbi:hypothetical protein FRC02_002624 [Tulasnella sp. 418]|nr:hypothetical protein FRC02_002624 [Tulasnella sp. 418]
MNPPDYVEIPPYASLIPEYEETEQSSLKLSPSSLGLSTKQLPLASSSLPASPSNAPLSPRQVPGTPSSTNGIFSNFSSMVVNQALASLPSPLPAQSTQRRNAQLLSAKDPLSIPITSANFRRFIAKCGFVFWLQDRGEEIIMWRRGWKYTSAWMAVYAFLCYYPRLTLLIPHVALLHILVTTYYERYPERNEENDDEDVPVPALVVHPGEGSADWLANVQAIQNLMGTVADLYDFVVPHLSHLTWTTPMTSPIFFFTLFSLFALIPIIGMIPLRPVFLVLGLTPFVLTHPYVLPTLPALIKPFLPKLRTGLRRVVDDDQLLEKHWAAPMKEVAVWENERWNPSTGWTSTNLRVGERKPWTRGQDGWSGTVEGTPFDGHVSSNLSFALPPGWKFVETEDWNVDLVGNWHKVPVDEEGWIYTDDSWLDPRTTPLSSWTNKGMTRRRRWTRRIYKV